MKNLLFLSILSASLFTGCGTSGGIFQQTPRTVTATNLVAVETVATNAATGVVDRETNLVPVVASYAAPIYAPSSNVVSGVATARQIGGTVAMAFPPAAPVISALDALLGLGLTILGAIAGIKTVAANKSKTKLAKTTDMLTAVVSGVEVAGSPDVKLAIQEHASVIGVTHALDQVVQAVTQNIPSRKSSP